MWARAGQGIEGSHAPHQQSRWLSSWGDGRNYVGGKGKHSLKMKGRSRGEGWTGDAEQGGEGPASQVGPGETLGLF